MIEGAKSEVLHVQYLLEELGAENDVERARWLLRQIEDRVERS